MPQIYAVPRFDWPLAPPAQIAPRAGLWAGLPVEPGADALERADAAAPTSMPPARALPPPQPTLEDSRRLARLNRLAQTLGRGFNIRLCAGARWGYDPVARTITCPMGHMHERSDTFAIGAVCRELGRLRYSRDEPDRAAADAVVRYLWNVVEALRTGRLLEGRYAGAADLLREVYETERQAIDESDPVLQFGEACLARWNGDAAHLAQLPAPVAAALAAVGPLLDEITAPPAHVDLAFDELIEAEMTAHAEAARLAITTRLMPALAAFLPVAAPPQEAPPEPAPEDESPAPDAATAADTAAPDTAAPPAAAAPAPSAGSGASSPAPGAAPGDAPATPTPAAPATPPPAASAAMERAIERLQQHLIPQFEGLSEPTPAAMVERGIDRRPAPAEAIDLEARLANLRIPQDCYERLCQRHADVIDMMERELERVFEARRHPPFTGYYKSGTYHLPRALQAKFRERATGIGDAAVFRRRGPPSTHSVAFVLVLDVSNSMGQGDRIANLQRGVAVLLEPARRLQMDVGIISYDITPQVLKQPGDDLSRGACAALLEALYPRNKNNELAALAAAGDMAAGLDAEDVYVIFVTDGAGDHALPGAIHALEENNPKVRVLGVGIGPGCSEVPALYARHLCVPNIEALPEQLAELFIGLQTGPEAQP